jgi:glutamyl-tRNA synthetase
MTGTLTLSAKTTPFPWGAVATALYTRQADLVFDEDASTLSLDLAGAKFSQEEDIVTALAKAGSLDHESPKVCSLSVHL